MIPKVVHLTLARSARGQRPRPGVRLHTLTKPPSPAEIRQIAGVPATAPERTIIDALEAGTQPEQVELALRQALRRGITTPARLQRAAGSRSRRARRLVESAVERVA